MSKFYANYKGDWYGPFDTYDDAAIGWHELSLQDVYLPRVRFKPSYIEEMNSHLNPTGYKNFVQRKQERKDKQRYSRYSSWRKSARAKRKHKCHCKDICGGKLNHNMEHINYIAQEQIKEYKEDS